MIIKAGKRGWSCTTTIFVESASLDLVSLQCSTLAFNLTSRLRGHWIDCVSHFTVEIAPLLNASRLIFFLTAYRQEKIIPSFATFSRSLKGPPFGVPTFFSIRLRLVFDLARD